MQETHQQWSSTMMHPEVSEMGERARRPKKKDLSAREVEVLGYMKDGLKNPEIAGELSLSTKTVENHVRNILLKLGVKNRTQAVVHGLKTSIIVF